MLERTKQITEIVNELIERVSNELPEDKAFLENALSGYLAALAYAELEKDVATILRSRFSQVHDDKVKSFFLSHYDRGQGRLKKSDLASLISHFGDDCKKTFDETCNPETISHYSNLLTSRHNIAHGEPSVGTLSSTAKGIAAADDLLNAFKGSIF